MTWSLSSPTLTKSPADWGLSNLRLEFTSQAPDSFTFTHDGAQYDSAPLFPYGTRLTLARDGVTVFQGIVIQTPRHGSGSDEAVHYRVAGPWWYLTVRTFQQPWAFITSSASPAVVAASYIPDILMNYNTAGAKITTATQIRAILQFAIDHGDLLQIGSITTSVDVPARQIKNLTCAQAIREQLRFLPDACIYFDYTTTPPTLHCKRRADLTPVSLAHASQDIAVQIRSREDIQVPSVVIHYIRTDDVDGQTYNKLITDSFPLTATGLESAALVASIDLKGARVTNTKATVKVETSGIFELTKTPALASIATIRSFLRTQLKWLDGRYVNIYPVPGSVVLTDPDTGLPAVVYPGQITEGTVPDWFPYNVSVVRIQMEMLYDKFDRTQASPDDGGSPDTYTHVPDAGSILTDKAFRHPVVLTVLTTDAPAGWQTVSEVESVEAGEPVPTGLAAYMYNALATLQWEGEITLTELEVSGLAGMGNVLNISDGREEWKTMNGMVQQMAWDLESGETTLTFGPPQQLGPQQLIEWLRGLRPITRTVTPKEQNEGITVNDGEVHLPKYAAKRDVGEGVGHGSQKLVVAAENYPSYIAHETTPGSGLGTTAQIVVAGKAGAPATRSDAGARLTHEGVEVFENPVFGPTPVGYSQRSVVKLLKESTGGDLKRGVLRLADATPVGGGSAQAATIAPDGLGCAEADPSGAGISLALADCVGGLAKRQIKIREIQVCVNNAVKKMLCVCSDPY